jgi:hypothetical protein
MTTAKLDKWTAFASSLAIPGLGQFVAGNWSCLGWLAASIALFSLAQQLGLPPYLSCGGLIALGLVSAEHAKRLLERRSTVRSGLASRVVVNRARGRGVSIRMEIDSTLSTTQMWRRVSDLSSFLTIDPFHEQVTPMRAEPRAGVDLALHHNVFGLRFVRFGRILSWQEGRSYAFSDLSRHDRPREGRRHRGRRQGFPHVFFVEIIPQGDDRCQLVINVRGRWTSRLMPVVVARHWLRWVFVEHARLLMKAL